MEASTTTTTTKGTVQIRIQHVQVLWGLVYTKVGRLLFITKTGDGRWTRLIIYLADIHQRVANNIRTE